MPGLVTIQIDPKNDGNWETVRRTTREKAEDFMREVGNWAGYRIKEDS